MHRLVGVVRDLCAHAVGYAQAAGRRGGLAAATGWPTCGRQARRRPSPHAAAARWCSTAPEASCGSPSRARPSPSRSSPDDAPVQHADAAAGDLRAPARRHRPDVHLRAHRLCPRPHRQLPHLRLRRRAPPSAEVRRRLADAPRHELHRRRRQDDRRRRSARAWACASTPTTTSRPFARTRRARHRAGGGDAARDRPGQPRRDGRG